ncbi:MAG: HAMP domain-containing protein [Deltaproteobacteria bacterium]|nr:HAMP domain-containing protein [Deltaproteobacteria bacterium]
MRGFFSTLRFRIILIVFLSLLPLLGMILYVNFQQRREAVAEMEENLHQLSRNVSMFQKRVERDAHQLLAALSRFPEVRRRDPAASSALFAFLLQKHPQYLNLGIADLQGNIFASGLPLPGPVNCSDRSWFQKALKTKDFALGQLQIGRITKKLSLNGGYPVHDEAGQVQAIVFAALDVELDRLAAEARLPHGSVVTISDFHGTIMGRYPDPMPWVGKTMPDSIVSVMQPQGQGTVQTLGLDGVSRLHVFTPLGEMQEGFVSVDIPVEVLYAQANKILFRNLIALCGVTILVLLLARFSGYLFVMRQINILVNTAERITAGDLGARTGLTDKRGEINRLAQAFDNMAEVLENREAELEKRVRERTAQLEATYKELEKTSQEVLTLNQEMEALIMERTMSEMALGMAHGIRNPLFVIGGFSNRLLKKATLNEPARNWAAAIVEEAKRLEQMVQRFEALAQRKEAFFTQEDLNEIIRDVLDMLQSEIKGNDIHLIKAFHPQPIIGRLNRHLIRVAFAHLLRNAIEATAPGGEIKVTTIAEREFVLLTIQDTGKGMSPEVVEKVFEPFYTTVIGGTGLGMVFIRQIVDEHRGSINLESQVGVGTKVTIRLPLRFEEPPHLSMQTVEP